MKSESRKSGCDCRGKYPPKQKRQAQRDNNPDGCNNARDCWIQSTAIICIWSAAGTCTSTLRLSDSEKERKHNNGCEHLAHAEGQIEEAKSWQSTYSWKSDRGVSISTIFEHAHEQLLAFHPSTYRWSSCKNGRMHPAQLKACNRIFEKIWEGP